MLSTAPGNDSQADRAAALCGLLNARQFLIDHHELPVGGVNALQVAVYGGSHEENTAEVDRIAGILGTPAEMNTGAGAYMVTHDFGGGVHYTASYLLTVFSYLPNAVPAQRTSTGNEATA